MFKSYNIRMPLMILALAIISITSSVQAYIVTAKNESDVPVKVTLSVKGIAGRWGSPYLLQPGQYAKWNTLAYCSDTFEVADARESFQIVRGDNIIPAKKFQVPSGNSCHLSQHFTVMAPLANPNATEQYYSIFGKQHSEFTISFKASLQKSDITAQAEKSLGKIIKGGKIQEAKS